MMNFQTLAKSFIGDQVEVMTASNKISGTFIAIDYSTLTLKISPDTDDPQTEIALVPVHSIEFIRVPS